MTLVRQSLAMTWRKVCMSVLRVISTSLLGCTTSICFAVKCLHARKRAASNQFRRMQGYAINAGACKGQYEEGPVH